MKHLVRFLAGAAVFSVIVAVVSLLWAAVVYAPWVYLVLLLGAMAYCIGSLIFP